LKYYNFLHLGFYYLLIKLEQNI